MGFFDNFYSSRDIGEFTNIQCQTKSFDPDTGGTLSQYWLSPSGVLFLIDYSHTADFHVINPGDDGYDEENRLRNFYWRPNGNHGGVRFFYKTLFVVIYPESFAGEWEQCPCARLHFQEGVLQNYVVSTMGEGFEYAAFELV